MNLFHQVTKEVREDGTETRDRESWFLIVPGVGGVEAWRSKGPFGFRGSDFFGGIEIHLKHDPENDFMGKRDGCWVTDGPCWTDGSSLAFDSIAMSFDDPVFIRAELTEWARSRGMI